MPGNPFILYPDYLWQGSSMPEKTISIFRQWKPKTVMKRQDSFSWKRLRKVMSCPHSYQSYFFSFVCKNKPSLKTERRSDIWSITHIIPLASHVFHRSPPHGVWIKPLSDGELQVELVFAAGHVDVSQVHGAAGVLPWTQHGGAWRTGNVYRVVSLHWGTFRG